MGKCYIIGACGFCESITPQADDFVIAADGGYKALTEKGIRADCVMGDFDSLGYTPEHKNTVIHPAEKDDTDTRLAVEYGYSLGYRKFLIFGGIGGRLDHTLANMQTLLGLSRMGAEGYLIGEGKVITVVENGSFEFGGKEKGYLSLFPADGAVSGVYLKGLRYTLDNAELFSDRALAVSNEFINEKALVRVDKGALYMLWYEDFKEGQGSVYDNNRSDI